MDIVRDEHMKRRCYFIASICSASLYGWYNYSSLFEPITNSFFTLYYQNCLLVGFYLGWDTYHMMLSPNRHLLYRVDLVVHHVLSLVACVGYLSADARAANCYLLMECISMMNYTWKNNPQLLKVWRTASVFCVRLPISFFAYFYYEPTFLLPHLKLVSHPSHYALMKLNTNIFLFYMAYDMFILWKIYKPTKQRTS
jgi:hypothetical protein